jgi:hypothetical protein
MRGSLRPGKRACPRLDTQQADCMMIEEAYQRGDLP